MGYKDAKCNPFSAQHQCQPQGGCAANPELHSLLADEGNPALHFLQAYEVRELTSPRWQEHLLQHGSMRWAATELLLGLDHLKEQGLVSQTHVAPAEIDDLVPVLAHGCLGFGLQCLHA